MPSALALILLIVLFPLLGGLAGAGEPDAPGVGSADLVRGNSAFACDLYGRLRGEDGNIFLSPYSISACLGMTRAGAAGNTAVQMDRVFHFPARDLGRSFFALGKAMDAPLVRDGWGRDAKEIPAYQISIANRLFGQKGFAFRRPFLTQMEKDYGAGLEQLDIERDPSGARRRINGWVARETRDKIKDLLPADAPTPDTRLVLVNAIYFKSSWAEAFSEGGTQDAPFYRLDGSTVTCRLMGKTDGYHYAAVDGAKILKIPYREGAMSMVVVLPDAKDGLSDLEAKLSPATIETWLGALKSHRVAVGLPKFEFSSSFDLTQTLDSMGMADAFSRTRADFSGMTAKEPLFIGLVVHKAFVAVDEAGTEAAAATAVAMKLGSAASPKTPVPFRADHPFLFFIRHEATGTILFLGRVTDPS